MSEVIKYVSQVGADVTLSESAKQHIMAYLKKQDGSCGIRLSVKTTGCSGLSYVVDYVQTPQPDDIVQSIDKHFDIYVDRKSYPYLKGVAIDYVREGLNSKLVFKNPNQTGQCGCGESFTVKGS
jgi:iron-sulfur cluster assembly accessory protein